MKITISILAVITFFSLVKAQTPMVQNRPCTFYSFSTSSPFTFRMPNQDNLFVDIFQPCANGNEDNPVFYKVKSTGSSMSFNIISDNCISGYGTSYDTQLTLWTGTCSNSTSGSGCTAPCNLTAIDCAWIHKLPYPANNITFPCTPNTEYFLQFDGVGEAQCTMGITFNPAQFTALTLPVELISFYGEALPNKNILYWTTAYERENAAFEIEKSMDGLHFTYLGTEPGQGNSTSFHHYSFSDENPHHLLNYYRLKQINFDGTFEYSKMISVRPIGDHLPVSIWPNPASQNLLVSYAASQDDVTLSITNMQGVTVYSRLIKSNQSFNQTEIPIENLPKGPYFFEYRVNGKVQIEKFIKL